MRRPRLEQLLDGHPDQQVTLVRGPVGAGKTVLVAQWVQAHDHPCAWFSAEATHNDPEVLLRHLLAAVISPFPNVDDVLGSRVLSDNGGSSVIREVLDQVVRWLGTGLTLVIDDVHRLRHQPALQILHLLVENPPPGARVVLISRSKPRLGLERARLRGDLVEVGPSDLRFQRNEIADLISSWTDPHMTATDLERATLGWAAGLRLAQLESHANDPGPTATGEVDEIATAYIREELIDSSTANLRSFLEVTCWLPVLTGTLMAAMASNGEGATYSAPQDMEGLPLLPVASQPGAFRYPRILSQTVQREFVRRNPDAARHARHEAARASRQAGDLLTAVELFLQAEDDEDAADTCAALTAKGESALRVVDELLQCSPDLARTSTRWLSWRIRASAAAGRIDEAQRLLEQADEDARSKQIADPDPLIARAVVAEHTGDVATLLECAGLLLDGSDQAAHKQREDTRAHGWRIRALVWSGDIDRARRAIRALPPPRATTRGEATVDAALARAWVGWCDGDISGSAELIATARRELCDNDLRAAELAFLDGSVHRERNQLAAAVPLLERAVSLAAGCVHQVVATLAASELAMCDLTAGKTLEAMELVVSSQAEGRTLPAAIDAQIRRIEARIHLERGDATQAQGMLRGAAPSTDTNLLAARVALEADPGRAHELVERVDARTPRQAVEKMLLAAQLPDGHPNRSTSLLDAVSAGTPLGLVRTFLDEGPAVTRKLRELALESSDRVLGRLGALASQELALAPAHGASPPIEQLTPRELAILRMLPLRMSNREMADQLYISVNTLKTHIRAIYRKLDVPHRSDAVRRAKALHLV